MKKFIGNFAGEDIILDDVEDAAAIALIGYLTNEAKPKRKQNPETCEHDNRSIGDKHCPDCDLPLY